MLIDWFTVIAQVINFLVLVWLLKRFLYKPVLRAIAARQEKIAAQLKEAEDQKREAEKQRTEYAELQQELAAKKDGLLKKAVADADTERNRLMEQARQEYLAQVNYQREAFRKEQDEIVESISRLTESELFAAADKMIADLADDSLQQKMIGKFLRRLGELSNEEKKEWQEQLGADRTKEVRVRSGTPLSSGDKVSLNTFLKETLRLDMPVNYEVDDGRFLGIELIANGFKVAWHVADYLQTLDRKINEVLHTTNGQT